MAYKFTFSLCKVHFLHIPLASYSTISNNGNLNIDLFYVWVALQANVSIVFLVFSNKKTQKRILSANRSLGERILRFMFMLYLP